MPRRPSRGGEFLGELPLLNHALHDADVRALEPVETAVINSADLNQRMRRHGDIGCILYRNLAAGLGAKLKRAVPHAALKAPL